MTTLVDKIEEYGRLQFDAGMDGASWDAGRRRDGRRSEEEAKELLAEITEEISKLQTQLVTSVTIP